MEYAFYLVILCLGEFLTGPRSVEQRTIMSISTVFTFFLQTPLQDLLQPRAWLKSVGATNITLRVLITCIIEWRSWKPAPDWTRNIKRRAG
jgi:hypothetical protein